MSQLDDLKKRYQELGEEIAKLEKQPKVPPKGWPVLVSDSGNDWFYSIWREDVNEKWPNWKYHALPDGRELSPENFKVGHKVEMFQNDIGFCIRVDGVELGCISETVAKKIAVSKFYTIGNEWVEV